ncbi:MAG: molybdopterin molybdotransferase MoeA [Candidatus Hodarchaeales archaeon]
MIHNDVRSQGFIKKIYLKDAIEIIQKNFELFPSHEIKLKDQIIVDKILRIDIQSSRNVPFFSRSAMDGFAVRAEDTVSASSENPVTLEVINEQKIGHQPKTKVEKGTAVKIPTGGVMPQGANAVIKIEDIIPITPFRIKIITPIAVMKNVSEVGEDIKKGRVLFKSGYRFRIFDKGFLLSAGIEKIVVTKTPTLAILSTGDELVQPWKSKLEIGQVPDVNSANIFELSLSEGWKPKFIGIIPDKFETLKSAIQKAVTNYDVVLLSGGTSVGTKDYVPRIFDELGELLFHGVSIRPGKPISAAKIQNKLVFGLPGYPVAALLTFQFIVKPAILSLLGLKDSDIPTIKARISTEINSQLNRLDFLRVRLHKTSDQEVQAIPISISGSGVLSTIIEADGIVIIPESVEILQKDEVVEVILIK